MTIKSIKSIAIIGGGSSGWLAANHLGTQCLGTQCLGTQCLGAEHLSRDYPSKEEFSITLISSPDIPIIGVGEGTVPAMRETLKSFGISETDFIRNCDATFKQSIKFVNWLDRSKHGNNNYYHHLFDFPFPFGDDLTPFWLREEFRHDYSDIVSVQGRICDAGLGPKRITDQEYIGETTYAYHMNAAKFAELLCRNAKEKYGVKHLQANVKDIILDNDGYIDSLITDKYGQMDFDFYVDCTGFASYLLGKKLQVPFIDKSDQLFTDNVLVAQIPKNKDSEIPPFTIATAHQAGWCWDIHLPLRRGVGFVYSNSHMSHKDAEVKFANYLGDDKPKEFRKIKISVGRREKFWSKNCVAIGMSQGFAEPLEATAILLADYSAKFLAKKFPKNRDEISILQNRFNKAMTYGWDRVFDFIKMHYCISDRQDAKFWLDNRAQETISDNLKNLLDLWKNHSPKLDDFFSKFEIFDVENYLYVLYGMRFSTKSSLLKSNYLEKSIRQYQGVQERSKHLLNELPKHRELLEKIHAYGLQKI